MVVLKELIFTVSVFRRYGSLERTDFSQFLYSGRYGGLERTDFYNVLDRIYWFLTVSRVWWSWKNWFLTVCIYWLRVWWSWKNWFLTVCHLVRYGGLERTDFKQFLLWWWSWKNWFLTVSILGRVWWFWTVLKELIFNSCSLFGHRVWWSWKKQFLYSDFLKRTVSILDRGCSGLERTDF